jgi:hypothetical protein
MLKFLYGCVGSSVVFLKGDWDSAAERRATLGGHMN